MVAAAAVVVFIALAAMAAAALPVRAPLPGQQAIPEHLEEMSLTDSTRQRRAHYVLLLGAGAAVVLSLRMRDKAQWLAPLARLGEVRTPLGRALTFALPVLILFLCRAPSVTYVASLALTTALVCFGRRAGQRRALAWAAAAVTIPYLLLLIVPGLALPLDPAVAGVPPSIAEAHYTAVLSQGDRLAGGLRLFSNVMPQYGLVVPELLGLAEKAEGIFSFGAHARLVQITQILFALAACLCYLSWSRGRFLEAALVLIPVAAMIHTLHPSVFCPNQSGLRFLGFPVGLLALIAVRRKERPAAFLLGVIGGALVVFNPETGLTIAMGYGAYLLSATVGRRGEFSPVSLLVRLVAGMAIVPVLTALVFWVGYGYAPIPHGGSNGYALTKFSAGYGGLQLYFGVGWIVILTHSLFEIVSGFLSPDVLSKRRTVRIAVATTIVVWFGYFLNRPHEWNLWTVYFLYGLFIIDFISPGHRRYYFRMLRQRRFAVGWAIVAMFVALQARNVTNAIRLNVSVLRHRTNEFAAGEISGVRVPLDYAKNAAQRAAFVRERAASGRPFYYLSGNVYLVPLLSADFQPLGDAYEVYSNDDFDRLTQKLRADGPPELLFDDTRGGLAGSPQRKHYYDRLKGCLLGAYRLERYEAGWEVWRRTLEI